MEFYLKSKKKLRKCANREFNTTFVDKLLPIVAKMFFKTLFSNLKHGCQFVHKWMLIPFCARMLSIYARMLSIYARLLKISSMGVEIDIVKIDLDHCLSILKTCKLTITHLLS